MSDNRGTDKSLVRKLSAWHFFRLFSGFIWVDFFILFLIATALFYTAEMWAAETWQNDIRTAAHLEDLADVSRDDSDAADVFMIETEEDRPNGLRLPGFLVSIIGPDQLSGSIRTFIQTADQEQAANQEIDSDFWDKTESLGYRVWIKSSDSAYFLAYDYPVGRQLLLIIRLSFIVLLVQGIYLLSGIGSGSKAIRRYLRPIAELAQSARQINEAASLTAMHVSRTEDDGSLSTLMGKIESISISDLDQKIAIDSTQNELKELAESINSMLDRINEAYRSQVRFVSDASHELRTPIAVIQGYANLLDRWGKNDPKALEESVAAIKSETQSMRDLVEQLLFLARTDNRTLQLVIERFSLSDLAEDLIRETEMIDSDHHFIRSIESSVYTKGDKQLIKQMLRIFIDNSTKYTPAGQQIQIKVNEADGYARIVIQDSGIGIPPEDVPHVFDRFFRADESRARKTGGTGLGLSIAKWIIDHHGGNVTLLSRQDIGTRITVELKSASLLH